MDAQPPVSQKRVFSACRRLCKEGRHEDAFDLLSDGLRQHRFDTHGVLHAGRTLQQLAQHASVEPEIRVVVLGQCTTSWLVPALTAVAQGRRMRAQVSESDYDNVLQGLNDLDPNVNAIVLVPWTQRLLSDTGRTTSDRIDDEMGFWQSAWAIAARSGDRHIVQVGDDWLDAGSTGHFLGSFDGDDRLNSADQPRAA